ncbi:MAG TPA: DUF2141 domain-containing protein [Candidatus Binataceae bacterium]|nr:DUF2141 domain-containing protein [Candidatus Binataceae bacterium]
MARLGSGENSRTFKVRRTILVMMLSAFIAAPAVLFAQPGAPTPNVLHVRVINLRNSKGVEVCTLFGSAVPEAFPSDDSKAIADAKAPVQFGAADCVFKNIKPGEYAVVTFHDENNNGEFDRDSLGLPEEEYGFSNDLRPAVGPPAFKDAAFTYKGGDQWLTIEPAN